jgi:superfamily II DNA/RNA helicase
MLFTSLGLSDPILNAYDEPGNKHPTPMNAKDIQIVLGG